MTTHLVDGTQALAPAQRPSRAPAAVEERRVLVVVRFPLGGIRTHVLYNYPTLAAHGYLPRLRRRADRLVTIPNGIDAGHYAHAAASAEGQLRARLGLDAQTRLVGFLGRFMEQKGFLPLLEALQQLLTGPSCPPFHL